MNKTQKWLQTRTSNILKGAGDVRLNKKGTIGTEPIRGRDGQTRTEVKLGGLGAVQIPTKSDLVKKAKATVKDLAAPVRKAKKDYDQAFAASQNTPRKQKLRKQIEGGWRP